MDWRERRWRVAFYESGVGYQSASSVELEDNEQLCLLLMLAIVYDETATRKQISGRAWDVMVWAVKDDSIRPICVQALRGILDIVDGILR